MAALAAGTARAQETIALPGVFVDAVDGEAASAARPGENDGRGPVEGFAAERTRTGTKTATPLAEIPQAVSVVGREEIDARGADKIDEALRYTPSVFTQPFGADSDTNWYYIRGFDATQTGDFLDGLQIPAFAFGDMFVDSFSLERIEVLKGPASVLYGGSNPGGIANAISKRPTGERLRLVRGAISEHGVGIGAFDLADAIGQAGAFRLVGKIEGGDGYTDFEDGARGFIAPSFSYEPDALTRFTVLANYTHIDERHGGGDFLPYVGTVVSAPDGRRIDREANVTEPDLDDYQRRQGSIGYEADIGFDNGITFSSSARFARASVEEQQLYANGYVDPAAPDLLNRVNFAHDTLVTNVLSDNRLTAEVATGPVEHTLLVGLDTKLYKIDQVQASAVFGTTTPISAFDPVYGTPQTEPVAYLNQALEQRQLGVYAQEQARIGGLIATLNARYDWVETESQDGPTFYAPTQRAANEAHFSRASGRAGLAYAFANGLTPYVSVASFFNPIIGTDGNGDFFEPETGEQYEVGVKYDPTAFDGTFTLSLFDLTRRNVPVTDPANIFAQVQRGEVRSRGAEFEAKVDLMDNLSATVALTAFELEITEDTDPTLIGKRPTILPERQASLFLDYTFDRGWADGVTLGAGLRYRGDSFADAENTLEVPDVALVDLKLGYERENWALALNVDNVFDERYVASCQTATACSFGEARTAKLTLDVAW